MSTGPRTSRHAAARRSRPRRRRWRATVCAVAGVAVVAGLLAAGGGYSAARTRLLSGAAWLVSSQVGQLTLLDGSSAEVAGQVQVAKPGVGLDVVQQGSNAYAVDRSAGSVRRVDGATFTPSVPATPIPGAGDQLQVFAAPETIYALDTGRGVLTTADPTTLANRSAPVPLAARVTPQAATLDADGRLWLLDAASGDLVWMYRGQRHVRRNAATPGAGLLTLAAGSPVLIDTQRHTADLLDPVSGATRHTTQLDLRPEDRIAVSGSANSPRIYVVASRGELSICALTAANCGTAVPLTAGGADPGAAVEVNDRLFVPDYVTGRVWIIDLGRLQVLAQPQVLSPATRFQLLARDGVVFFNDPESARAGVIRLDGGVRQVAKYDPKDPGKGVSGAGGGAPGRQPQPPTNRTPTTQPTRPPGGTPTSTAPPQPQPPGGPADNPPLMISVSNAQPLVNEDVRLSVTTLRAPTPVSAHWTFGDGQQADGLSPTHHWSSVQTFQVSVQATFPDGRNGITSVPIQVVAQPVGTLVVTINDFPRTGTVASQPGGISCPPTCSADFAPGTAVTLTATPAAGLIFDRWTGACTGTSPTCQLTVQNGQNDVMANFVPAAPPPMVNVTVSLAGTGSGRVTGSGLNCPGTCTVQVAQGASVTLTETPTSQANGFTGWTGGCAGFATTCTFTANADATVTATFIALLQLTVDVQDSLGQQAPNGCCALDVAIGGPIGNRCTGHCVFFGRPNASVTITVVSPSPQPGWFPLNAWGGDCTVQGIIGGVDTCRLTMNGTKAVQKMFVQSG